MMNQILAAVILYFLIKDTSSKPYFNKTLASHLPKRRQDDTQLMPGPRQRPPSANRPSWNSPPSTTWVDDPPAASNDNLLPVLYLMAPLVVTAMLMPIGATLIATILLLKANNPSYSAGSFKSLLFPRDEEVAPIFRILEQNMLDLLKRIEDAIAKYDNNT